MTNMHINPESSRNTRVPPAEAEQVPPKDQGSPQQGIVSGLFGSVVSMVSWCATTVSNCFHSKEVDELSKDELSHIDQKIERLGPGQTGELQDLPELEPAYLGEEEKIKNVAENALSASESQIYEIPLSARRSLKEITLPQDTDMDYFSPEMLSVTGKIRSLEVGPPHFDVLDALATKENNIVLAFKSALEIGNVDWMKETFHEVCEANFPIRSTWERVVDELGKEDKNSDQYQLASSILEEFDSRVESDKSIDHNEAFSACLNILAQEKFEDRLVNDLKDAIEDSDLQGLQNFVNEAKLYELPIAELWMRAVEGLQIEDQDSLANAIIERFDNILESDEAIDHYEAFTVCLNNLVEEEFENKMIDNFKAAIEIVDVIWLKGLVKESQSHKLPIAELWTCVVDELRSTGAHSDESKFAERILTRFNSLKNANTGLDDYKLFEGCLRAYENSFISEESTIDEVRRQLKRD